MFPNRLLLLQTSKTKLQIFNLSIFEFYLLPKILILSLKFQRILLLTPHCEPIITIQLIIFSKFLVHRIGQNPPQLQIKSVKNGTLSKNKKNNYSGKKISEKVAAMEQISEKQNHIEVPFHERAYSYNKETSLKVITLMLQLLQTIRSMSQKIAKQETDSDNTEEAQINRAIVVRTKNKLQSLNGQFVNHHELIRNRLKIASKVKYEEIKEKFRAEEYLWRTSGTDLSKHLYVIKQLYVKANRVRNFIFYNEGRVNQISIEHEMLMEGSKQFMDMTKINNTAEKEIVQVERSNEELRRKLESQYMDKNRAKRDHSLVQIRRLAELVNRKEISNPITIGFWTGTMILILALTIFLINYFDINFKSEPQFEKTFPIWRGLSYFVFLIWVFALQSYVFENFGITFRLITTMNNFYIPKYPGLILCAAFFTSLHMLMFLFYVLALAEFGITFPDNFELHYLPAVSWIIMILFFMCPVKVLYFRTRLYPISMLLRAFASPILGTEVKFHWWTEIWVSFRQPFRDLVFTFNYYFIDSQIVYENTIIYETIAGIFLYSMRIIQNIRQMRQNNVIGGMPFYGSIKCSLNIITMLTSYFCRIEEKQLPLIPLLLWILSAIVSTTFAYLFDLKWDWGLLQPSSGNKCLRKELIYGKKKLYYTIIVMNLLFRFIWVLNISPDILRRIPLERYLLILIISFLEITRRGFWSMLRMERQHIMLERYYDSIGITTNKQEEKKKVQFGNLLVEMQDLNKTYIFQTQKGRKQIYNECQQGNLSPLKIKRKSQIDEEPLSQSQPTNKQLLDGLSTQIEQNKQHIEHISQELSELISTLKSREFSSMQEEQISEIY